MDNMKRNVVTRDGLYEAEIITTKKYLQKEREKMGEEDVAEVHVEVHHSQEWPPRKTVKP